MFRSSRDVGSVKVNKYQKASWTTQPMDEAEMFGCDFCSEGGWTSETEVELHKTKKHYNRSFMNGLRKREDYCCICIKEFENKEAVIRHIKTEHLLSSETCMRVEREIFVCELCEAIFFNKQNLIIHLRYAHLNSNINFVKCVLCFRSIRSRNIPAHFYMHDIQSVSTCRICLHKCLNSKKLDEHLKDHPYYLKCEICYFETTRLDAFQNHISINHKKPSQATTNNDPMPVDERRLILANVEEYLNQDDGNDDPENEVNVITIIEIRDNDSVADLESDFNDVSDSVPQDVTKKKLVLDTDNVQQDDATDTKEDSSESDCVMKEVTRLEKELTTDNENSSNAHDKVKRYFIPKKPAFLRLQRVAGIRGIRLSNNVHVCVLCREVCVGLKEMRSHIQVHKAGKEKKGSTYECSCGEDFSSKVLLKHHAFKNKHVIDVK